MAAKNTNQLLAEDERLGEAITSITCAKRALETLGDGVTKPLHLAIIEIDNARIELAQQIGQRARREYADRPRAMEPSHAGGG